MDEQRQFWLNNKYKFYIKLDEFLKQTDQKLDMYETNPISQIFIAFEYWLSKQDKRADMSNEDILNAWLDKNKDNNMYFSKGYENIMNYDDVLIYASSNENIVKKTCKELGITQKELAELLDAPQSTVNRWASTGDIPKMADKYLQLLLETKDLKEKFEILKQAHKILSE